jgi:HAD superfamily hydrolase (TIGR01509 family)
MILLAAVGLGYKLLGMGRYKAVFLDIGGVILQIDWARPFTFAGIFDPRQRHELIETFHGAKIFHLSEKGLITPHEFFAGLGQLVGQEREEAFWREAWLSLIVGELPDVEQLFSRLKNRVPLYALSNTNSVHFKFQRKRFPILAKFDRFFASHELRERKPDAACFLQACRAVGVEPDQCLFVDDTLENVEGARRVGMTAEHTINSVRDTLDFLDRHLD